MGELAPRDVTFGATARSVFVMCCDENAVVIDFHKVN